MQQIVLGTLGTNSLIRFPICRRMWQLLYNGRLCSGMYWLLKPHLSLCQCENNSEAYKLLVALMWVSVSEWSQVLLLRNQALSTEWAIF